MKITVSPNGVVWCDGIEIGIVVEGKFAPNDGVDKKTIKAVEEFLAAQAKEEGERSKAAQSEQERLEQERKFREAAAEQERRRLEAENAQLRADLEKHQREAADKEKSDLEAENARLRALLEGGSRVPTGHAGAGAAPQRPAPVDIHPDPSDPEPERNPELGCLSPGLIEWRLRHWSPEDFNYLYPPARLQAIKSAGNNWRKEMEKRARAAASRGELTNEPDSLENSGLGQD